MFCAAVDKQQLLASITAGGCTLLFITVHHGLSIHGHSWELVGFAIVSPFCSTDGFKNKEGHTNTIILHLILIKQRTNAFILMIDRNNRKEARDS